MPNYRLKTLVMCIIMSSYDNNCRNLKASINPSISFKGHHGLSWWTESFSIIWISLGFDQNRNNGKKNKLKHSYIYYQMGYHILWFWSGSHIILCGCSFIIVLPDSNYVAFFIFFWACGHPLISRWNHHKWVVINHQGAKHCVYVGRAASWTRLLRN